MRLTFLGTGTSHGVPMIGCDCAVCRSEDPRDRRLRSSVWVEARDTHLLIDAGPDFRTQALRAGLPRVDALLLTHTHADHVLGIDDLRRFNELQRGPVPVYGNADTLRAVRHIFAYAFDGGTPGSTRPALALRPVPDRLAVGPFTVEPLEVEHGPLRILGYRLEADGRSAAYVPDCSALPGTVLRRLAAGVDVMILDALRPQRHPTHFSLAESLSALAAIGARRSFLTHMSHTLGHAATAAGLPPGVEPAWDGLALEW